MTFWMIPTFQIIIMVILRNDLRSFGLEQKGQQDWWVYYCDAPKIECDAHNLRLLIMNDSFHKRLNQINEMIGRSISWLVLATVMLTFLIVVLRYGFDWGSIAMQESVLYLHALVFMAGAAYTLGHDEHVRVDIFYGKLSPQRKAWVDLIGTLLFLLPFCIFTIWVSLPYVSASWRLLEGSREAGGLPLVFLLKTFIPLMAALLLLQGLSTIGRSLKEIR